jgi:hypothetical protein
MYSARCYRTLDRPITVFGLEIEDLLAVILVSGGLLFAAGPFAGIGGGFLLYVALCRLKAGKPPGHLFERLYRARLIERLPFLGAPHLAPLKRRFSAVTCDEEAEDPAGARYWGTK